MTVVPLAYAAGQRPAYNLTLMPGLVKNHDHAARLVESPFMQELEKIMAQDDVMVLVHGYLAGGFGGKETCITKPDDVKGLKIRAAGKSFEQMVAAAGASVTSMPSSEIYSAMQTGVLDAATLYAPPTPDTAGGRHWQRPHATPSTVPDPDTAQYDASRSQQQSHVRSPHAPRTTDVSATTPQQGPAASTPPTRHESGSSTAADPT